jgi:hypothetical protein
MGAGNVIFVAQVLAYPDSHSFLPGIEMGESGDLAFLDFQIQTLFEFPDGFHSAVSAK